MKKQKIQINTLLLLFCLTVFTSHAQDKKEQFKAMHQEMREYAKQNVLPIVKEQRLKLEAQLSAADKAVISNVREQLHQQRKTMHAEMKTIHQRMKSGEEFDKEEMHKRFAAMKAQREEIIAPAKVVLEKHQTAIDQLLTDKRIDKEGWKNEMESIRKKYISEEDMEEMKKKHHGKRHKFHAKDGEMPHKNSEMGNHHKGGKHEHHRRMMHKNLKPMGFLLWDPNAPMPSIDEEQSVEFGVYPNPSTAQNKIDFSIAQKGQVKIELLDKQGNIVKTVLNDTKKAGDYTIDVNLDKLPNAVYYYRITTASGSKTKRFLLDK